MEKLMKRMDENPERRNRVRFHHISPIGIIGEGDEQYQRGKTVNISAHGLYFESDSLFKIGSDVWIAIYKKNLGKNGSNYDCYHGKIVWKRNADESFYKYCYGVETTNRNTEHLIGATELFSYPEKRNDIRKEIRVSVNIDCAKKVTKGITKNYSKSGMFIEAQIQPKVGEIIYLTIGKRKSLLEAKVVWSGRNGFGVQFIHRIY
jgi:hypothetical protein